MGVCYICHAITSRLFRSSKSYGDVDIWTCEKCQDEGYKKYRGEIELKREMEIVIEKARW